jgi:hypothetical protein
MNRIWKMQVFLTLLLATTVYSQEGIIGTWKQLIEEQEEDFGASTILKIKADGTMEFVIEGDFDPDFIEFSKDVVEALPGIPVLTEVVPLAILVQGSWKATETQFTFSPFEVGVFFDGLSSQEFFEGFVRDIVAALAVELEISEADLPTYEEETVALLLEDLYPQGLEEMLSADLLEDWTVQFSFDEERLIFTDEFDLEGTAYVRAELSSAVVGTSWGDVKAMLR